MKFYFTARGKDCEIDILALGKEGIILAECKWRNKQQGMDVYRSLYNKSKRFTHYRDKYFYIFCRSGFTQDFTDFSLNHPNIFLVDIDEML